MSSLHGDMLLEALLFGQLDWQSLWEEHGIPLAVMGLFVVFAALTLLRIFIGLLPRIMAVVDRIYPSQEEAVTTDPVVDETSQDNLNTEILVVIAAAVAATVIKPHRIVRTQELTPEDMSWSLEGRLQHHASHRIQPRNRS